MAVKRPSVAPGRTYAGESADVRLARQRRQFMEAGLALFGSVGYRVTTVRMLCKEAGLIDRYFYKNFNGTEDLLAAVYTESFDRIEADVLRAITPALRARDPGGVVEVGLDAFFEAVEDSRVARVCWLEVLGVSERIDAMYTQRIQKFADLLVSVSKELFQIEPRSEEESRIIGIAMVGAISQSALYWLLSDYAAERKVLVSANSLVLRGTESALLTAIREQEPQTQAKGRKRRG